MMRNAHLALLLLDWLNQRYDADFALSQDTDPLDGAYIASEGARRVGLSVAPMWEEDAAWEERLRAARDRLDALGLAGAHVLWLPPGAAVPADEPAATSFAQRLRAAAGSLSPGERAEVLVPATIKLAKMRDEGGYASVVGGLSRWWTRITENVQGTFSVDSRAVHRITRDGAAREELWGMIGRLASGITVGQSAEFEIDEAWTLQRLPDNAAPGFALVGAPPGVDPTDGVLIRRMARKRLGAAKEALAALDVHFRVAGLVGAYEYVDVETASGTLKAIDPGIYSRIEVVALLVDGEVKPVFAPKTL